MKKAILPLALALTLVFSTTSCQQSADAATAVSANSVIDKPGHKAPVVGTFLKLPPSVSEMWIELGKDSLGLAKHHRYVFGHNYGKVGHFFIDGKQRIIPVANDSIPWNEHFYLGRFADDNYIVKFKVRNYPPLEEDGEVWYMRGTMTVFNKAGDSTVTHVEGWHQE